MTKTISINYDLRNPGRNYDALYTAIKNVGSNWAHPLESMWIIVTSKTCAQVRDALSKVVDQNDRLLVANFGPDWASWNISKEVTDCLK